MTTNTPTNTPLTIEEAFSHPDTTGGLPLVFLGDENEYLAAPGHVDPQMMVVSVRAAIEADPPEDVDIDQVKHVHWQFRPHSDDCTVGMVDCRCDNYGWWPSPVEAGTPDSYDVTTWSA